MKKNYLIPAIRIANSKLVTSVIECSGESTPPQDNTPTTAKSLGTDTFYSKKMNVQDDDDDFWSTK